MHTITKKKHYIFLAIALLLASTLSHALRPIWEFHCEGTTGVYTTDYGTMTVENHRRCV